MINNNGHFGRFGGKFVPESMVAHLNELFLTYEKYKRDDSFVEDYNDVLRNFIGRPTRLYFAKKLSEELKGAKIYFKREDLCYGGSSCVNSAAGHILLAKRLGKKKIITTSANGNNGLAVSLIASRLHIHCQILMGEKDFNFQTEKIAKMRYLGAEVKSLAGNFAWVQKQALALWMNKIEDYYFIPTSVTGPAPLPEITRDFQTIIGAETYRQIFEIEGRQPNFLIAAAKGGAGALGFIYPFLKFKDINYIVVEHSNSASLAKGKPGIFQGAYTYILQNEFGQINYPELNIAAFNYPAVGPELSYLKDLKKIENTIAAPEEIKKAIRLLADTEGLICSLETAPAIAEAIKRAPEQGKEKIIVVCFAGSAEYPDIAVVTNKVKKEIKK